MKSFFNKSLARKIAALAIGGPLILGIMVLLVSSFLFYNATQTSVDNLDQMLRRDFDITAKYQVQTVHSLIKTVYKMAEEGKISDARAQELAKDLVRELKYGEEGYFWIDTQDGTNLVYLGTESEGTNRYDMKDSNGKMFFHEINEKAQEDSGGYTDYWFPKKGEEEASPKRSYSLAFKPYDWVIGTGNYIDDIEDIVAVEIQKNNAQLQRSIISLVLIVLGVLVFAAILAFWISKRITQPIIQMVGAVEEISEGNMRVAVETKLEDEIGTMGKSMMVMIANLTRIVERIKEGTKNITNSSQEVSSSAETIAQGANEQASSTEEISSSMEQMTASISQNSMNAHEAATIANSASINVGEVNVSFGKMRSSLKEITDKISIIHEIAEKTDLLAVNASIEAAKAENHGKGFAVVANEVRQLAIRCRTAADEIDHISVESVTVSNESSQLLEGLIPEIQKTTSLIREISAASTEQDTGAQQINQALQQLTNVTQQNSASAEELAAAASNLEELAGQLKETISFLVVNGEDEDEVHGLLDTLDKYNAEINKIKAKIANRKVTKKRKRLSDMDKSQPKIEREQETQSSTKKGEDLPGVEIDMDDDEYEKF